MITGRNVLVAILAVVIVGLSAYLIVRSVKSTASTMPRPEFLEQVFVPRTEAVEGRIYELNQPVAISWKTDPSDGVEKFEISFGGRDRNMFPYYVDRRDIRRNTSLP